MNNIVQFVDQLAFFLQSKDTKEADRRGNIEDGRKMKIWNWCLTDHENIFQEA